MKDKAAGIDLQCINTIRFLSADAVQKAKSGHPGAPMGMAAAAYTLWDRFLKHNPKNPAWPDRDRFVLSAGHASMLLYSLLHLSGYDLPMEEIMNFRQWESKTPGHPEYGLTAGVEITTGPLGQGFAHGVGMAVAARSLAAAFNRPGHDIVSHFIYGVVSDGDVQEGVASEAASLAGTLGLGNIIYLYDDNGIQIEGSTSMTFTENVGDRFAAYGWQVIGPVDGFDLDMIGEAIRAAQAEKSRPSLIICKTIIGYGSPRENSCKSHGEPLGEENVRAAKDKLGWPLEPAFLVTPEVRAHIGRAAERGAKAEADWQLKYDAYKKEFPDLAAKLELRLSGGLPAGWDAGLDAMYPPDSKPTATRNASGKILNALAARIDAIMGGSADLAPSNKTLLDGATDLSKDNPAGRNIHFGVREHAMAAVAGGMALHGGFIPYTGTFLQFADYMRPSIRLAALMGIRVIYIFSHDSIGLGEDGPTHQPIEQIASLRLIPNLTVIRPADATETVEAWKAALQKTSGPTVLLLTRQDLPVIDRGTMSPASSLQRGAYTLWQSAAGAPDAIVISTGSEVPIALDAARRLADGGMNVRVVSMPSWEMFERQTADYKNEVLPTSVAARVAIEAGVTFGWDRYVGPKGKAIGIDRFGASAPYKVLYEKFGITADAVVLAVKDVLTRINR
jgi:transketolase